MQWRNDDRSYGLISRALHWGSALLVFGLFGLGLWMSGLDFFDSAARPAYALHKSGGVLLLALLVVRLLWRLVSPAPAPLVSSNAQRLVTTAVHGLLYAGVLALCVSGYLLATAEGRSIEVFGLFSLPPLLALPDELAGEAHELLAWALILLSGLHAAAALYHHVVLGDATLRRMLGRPQ